MIEAKVIKRSEWTDGLVTIQLDRDADFVAGQFFNLALSSQGDTVRRSYSAASEPGAALEFFISEVKGGELTPGLLALNVGDTVAVDEKALGFFTLAEVPECKELWLVATGTGLGPYISMLRQSAVHERFEKIVVVHGARTSDQLAYADELRQMSKERPGLIYLPTLSGVDAKLPEGAVKGRITESFDAGSLEEKGGSFGKESHMLLCGNPQMIEDMVGRLKERGYEKHRRRKPGHFNFERYW